MARQLKPQSIGMFYDEKTHTSVEMFLDRNDHFFFAKFGDQTYERMSKYELVEKLREVVRADAEIAWKPLIEVKRLQAVNTSAWERAEDPPFVGFKLYRMYYGRLTDGTWITASWDLPESARLGRHQNLGWGKDKEFNPPCARPGYNVLPNTYFLPYDETSWAALSQLVENIRAVRRKLDEMLASEEGVGQLVKAIAAGMATKMLGPGEGEP